MRQDRYKFIVQFKDCQPTIQYEGTVRGLQGLFMGLAFSEGNVKRILAKSI